MFYVLRVMFYFMLYYILCYILCSIYVPFHVRRYIILLQNSDTQFLLFQVIAFHCSQYWSLVSAFSFLPHLAPMTGEIKTLQYMMVLFHYHGNKQNSIYEFSVV